MVDNNRSVIIKSSFLLIMSVIVEDWGEGQRYSAHKLSIFEKKKSGLTSLTYAVGFVRDAPPASLFWRFIGKSREENLVTRLKKNLL